METNTGRHRSLHRHIAWLNFGSKTQGTQVVALCTQTLSCGPKDGSLWQMGAWATGECLNYIDCFLVPGSFAITSK